MTKSAERNKKFRVLISVVLASFRVQFRLLSGWRAGRCQALNLPILTAALLCINRDDFPVEVITQLLMEIP